MKKVSILSIFLCEAAMSFAQSIAGLQIAEIIASDDFNNRPCWSQSDSVLNNALGETQTLHWSNTLMNGSVGYKYGKSALTGSAALTFYWGGSFILRGFTIDTTKIYQLEIMVHPEGGSSGGWNNYSAVHLFAKDDKTVWQSTGIRSRISNNADTAGCNSPSRLAYDAWVSKLPSGVYALQVQNEKTDASKSARIVK
jgi:hypothetical protein